MFGGFLRLSFSSRYLKFDPAYADAGSYLSPVYDAGRNVEWDNLSWLGSTPAGTQIKLQVATSDTPDGPWDFRGPDGLPNSYFIDPTPTSVGNSVISRYCRIKAYLGGDGSATPTLGGIDLSFSGDWSGNFPADIPFELSCLSLLGRL